MGSSSKSGSGTTRHYYASIPAIVGWGPIYGICAIILNGERVWSGSLLRSSTTNPVTITTKYGTIRFYWGTEDQPADPLLGGRRYKGLAYIVFVDFDHGQATNAYNTEVILLGGAPQQSIVTGAAAEPAYANGIAVNPIALTAEILTSPYWRGLTAADLDVPSFQALADAVPSTTAISPLYNDAADLRSVLVAATGMVDGWLRRTPAGKIQAGRWLDSAATDVTVLTHDDFTEIPKTLPSKNDDVPNSYAVEFVDRTALHKEAKIAVNDDAALAVPGAVLNRKTLSASHLITYEQADLAGHEALRRAAKADTWSGSVRIGKARTPTGARIQPGDYLRVPISQPKESVQRTQLVRVRKVTWSRDATAAVQVEADLAPVAAPVLSMGISVEPVEVISASVPPINHARVFALPSSAADVQPPIHVVAARPCDTALGFDIHFDTELAGDFPSIARSSGYALPVQLGAAIAASATTLRLSMLAVGADGQSYQRDATLLRNWTGGATQGRNDELLVLLFALDGGGQIVAQEVCSVAGTPTLVSADTFDVPVLRGRLGTTALAHATTVEAWVVHSSSLADVEHADIMAAASSGATLYFQPGAYTLRETYAPAEAWTERARRTAAEEPLAEYAAQPDASTWVPTLSLVIPAGYLPPADDGPLPGGSFADLQGSMFTQSPTVALEWCAAADYLTFYGFSEYAPSDESGLSVPWKKYLTRNLSGSVELLSRVGPFVFSYNGYTATLSGSAQYTLGGAYSNTGLLTGVGDLNQGGCSWPSGGGSTAADDCPNCADLPSPVTTRTSRVVTGAAPTWSGSLRADLADEVTEDALIAYWLANTAAFSGWSSTAGVAAYEPRTTSFQFYYSLLRGRGTGSNAVAGWTYTLEIPTEVRTYGSTGAWSAGESVTSEVVADSSGNFTIAEFEIRASRGYERRPTGTCNILTGVPPAE